MLDGTIAFQHEGDNMLLEYPVPGEDGSTQAFHGRWNGLWFRKIPAAGLPGRYAPAASAPRAGSCYFQAIHPVGFRPHRAADGVRTGVHVFQGRHS